MDKSKLRKFYRYCWFWLTTIFFLIQVNCLVAQGQIYAFIGRNARNAPPVVYDHEPGRALLNLLGFFVIGPLPLLGVWFFAPLDLLFKPKHLPPQEVHQAELLEHPEKISEWRVPPR